MPFRRPGRAPSAPSLLATHVSMADALIAEHAALKLEIDRHYAMSSRYENLGAAYARDNTSHLEHLAASVWEALAAARAAAAAEGCDVSEIHLGGGGMEAATAASYMLKQKSPQVDWAGQRAEMQELGEIDLVGWKGKLEYRHAVWIAMIATAILMTLLLTC